MGIPIYQVDAFTDQAFRGNPAAVCLLEAERHEAWMQSLAAEMNLSETAFLHRSEAGVFRLRWFTPKVEVDLCGHATLASAHVLWTEGYLPPKAAIRFATRSGELGARGSDGWIELDFPALPPRPVEPDAAVIAALGVAPAACARGPRFDVVEVASEREVRAARPDFARLAALGAPMVAVTGRSDDWDFVSRCFCVPAGIDEDPVTGAAHCTLAPYWAARLGRTEMTAFQASPRGGVVRLRLEGERVALGGQAVTVLRGVLA
jgi:PhzF family phenazine biosynthesis protein